MLMGGGGGGHNRERSCQPHAINPTATTHGHFVLFPVSLALKDQHAANMRPFELNERHLRSHRKIGDCKQSNPKTEIEYFVLKPKI